MTFVRRDLARVEAPAAASAAYVNTPALTVCFCQPGIKWSGAAGHELQLPKRARAGVLQRDGQTAVEVVGKDEAQSITAMSIKHPGQPYLCGSAGSIYTRQRWSSPEAVAHFYRSGRCGTAAFALESAL